MKMVLAEPIEVTHRTIEIEADFDKFTSILESILGRFDPGVGKELATDPDAAETMIKNMEGEQGLMLFGVQDHGALFVMLGQHTKAKRYHIGNPLIAIRMTRHDVRAGLYAPMTILVYQVSSMKVRIDYDQPSTQFGQFKDENINAVAAGLDIKLEKLIGKAAQLSD